MGLFAVSYQLNKDKNYPKLWDALKELSAHKVMRSFYFLDLDTESTKDVKDHFVQFIDKDDAVCIVKIESKPAHRMGNKGTNDWINERF